MKKSFLVGKDRELHKRTAYRSIVCLLVLLFFPFLCTMIAFLTGSFARKTPSFVHIDVHGVGYEVQISLNTYTKIQDLESGTLQTHLIVREDAQILFGFADESEKGLFLQLITVSGIGSNTARVMLSYMKPDELSRAIAQGNVKALEAIKGIGRKTAERLIVELRDKLSKHPVEADVNISSWKSNTLQTDALNALIALGISRQVADGAIQKVLQQDPGVSVEVLIKKALQML